MTALRQTLTSLRHRPGRALLTALGTALGIGTIVALLAVSAGATQKAGQFVNLGRSDLALFQRDAADPTTSVLPIGLMAQLRRVPGVADTQALQLLVSKVPHAPGAIVFGADPNAFETARMVYTSGRPYAGRDEIALGDALAPQLHAHPGDVLTVAGRRMRVTGIYHIGITYEDAGAFVPLATAQAISGHPGEATLIGIKLGIGTRPSVAQRRIARRFPGLAVIGTPDESLRAGANGQLLANVTLVIVVLALLIGGIGVMNTMLMAVIERRTEFAILSAVGWSGPQVAGLVLSEGVIVSLVGAGVGVVIGWIGARLLIGALGAQAFVTPQVTGWILGRALLIGLVIGVLGGLYPAWRAARLSPARALAQQ